MEPDRYSRARSPRRLMAPGSTAGLLALALSVAASGCGGGGGGASTTGGGGSAFTPPTSFKVSDASVAEVVEHTISKSELATRPRVHCRGDETLCLIRYTVKQAPGSRADQNLIEPTRQVWKAMFADARFKGGSITVDGPTKGVAGRPGTGELFTLRCGRAAAARIDWERISGKRLRRFCSYTALAKGF